MENKNWHNYFNVFIMHLIYIDARQKMNGKLSFCKVYGHTFSAAIFCMHVCLGMSMCMYVCTWHYVPKIAH